MIIEIKDIEGRKLSRVDVSVVFEDGESVSYTEQSKEQETVSPPSPTSHSMFIPGQIQVDLDKEPKPIPPEMKDIEF